MNNRLRELREDRDLTQKNIADVIKCTQVCYSYYENGQRDIPTDTLAVLAKFYNTSIDYLLRLTDVDLPYPRNDLQQKRK